MEQLAEPPSRLERVAQRVTKVQRDPPARRPLLLLVGRDDLDLRPGRPLDELDDRAGGECRLVAAGDPSAWASGAAAEVVERSAWTKVETVLADERETGGMAGGRIALNLGHSLGHAIEAAAGFGDLLHGEAVAYGLRAATRIGVAVGVTPAERAARIGRLLDALGLATDPLPYPLADVLGHMATDKKHAGGRLRWVLPTADGVLVRDDVDPAVVERAAASLLAAPTGSPR